jgi:hypothetical protein
MKLSRRALLTASLGMGQLALLEQLGPLRSARAGTPGPTRLLVLYLQGGYRPYTFFVPPMPDAAVASVIPPPTQYLQEPVYFTPSQLVELGPASGGFQPLRIAQLWNPADPSDRTGYKYTPAGYGWIDAKLANNTAVIHGVDQGAFDHGGAYTSAMCGVPGATYVAPAFVSVIANYLNQKFSDTRPLPCVAIRESGMPNALGLPAAGSPILISSFDGISKYFSTDPSINPWWAGHQTRTAGNLPPFASDTPARSVQATDLERFVMERTRALRGRSTTGTDAIAQQIYDGYVQVSATLAQDVVSVLEATKGISAFPNAPAYCPPTYGPWTVQFGAANAHGYVDLSGTTDTVLRLLESDLCSVVYAFVDEVYYDFHMGETGNQAGTALLRGELDIISRMMSAMKQTPAPGQPGKTLYDDTLVVILSEFSRTWAQGPDQTSTTGWKFEDDHFNYTSVILTGGNTAPNRQIGGFDTSPLVKGQPVAILESTGSMDMRFPTSADVIATICGAFGMNMGTDFTLPGGYGQIQGAIAM